MIALWFLGDGGRFLYYIYIGAPAQFIIGGILTVCMDGVVLAQFFLWRHKMLEDEFGEDTITMETMEGDMKMEKSQIVANVSL
jgi:hypothetical protein